GPVGHGLLLARSGRLLARPGRLRGRFFPVLRRRRPLPPRPGAWLVGLVRAESRRRAPQPDPRPRRAARLAAGDAALAAHLRRPSLARLAGALPRRDHPHGIVLPTPLVLLP